MSQKTSGNLTVLAVIPILCSLCPTSTRRLTIGDDNSSTMSLGKIDPCVLG